MKASLVDRGAVERLCCLAGALKSGLIDALASGEALSVQHIAMVAGTDARASRIVLDALVVEGVVQRVLEADDGSFYALTPLGKAHLVDEGPELERAALLHRANRCGAYSTFPTSSGPAHRRAATRTQAMSAAWFRRWGSATQSWWRRSWASA